MKKRKKSKPVSKKKNQKNPLFPQPKVALSEEVKKYLLSSFCFLLAVVFIFSFTNKAGFIGETLKNFFFLLIGNVYYITPIILIVSGIVILKEEEDFRPAKNALILSIIFFILSASAMFSLGELRYDFSNFNIKHTGEGGWFGYIISWPMLKGFDFWVSFFVLVIIMSFSLVILLDPILKKRREMKVVEEEEEEEEIKPEIKKEKPLIELVKKIEPRPERKEEQLETFGFNKNAKGFEEKKKENPQYKYPPLDLLSSKKGIAEGGDIEYNSSVIKRTLQTFGIPVEMSEVNIGPTVTQYTLKPAEGIKLSKITALQSDLALALASSTIRIEAPIPGRSLVGVEIPNKRRAVVGLREILDTEEFKKSPNSLYMALGKDVRGNSAFADLAEMPHLLVGGTTGSGKTICLNSIILSFLYRNSPEEMKLVLVDPKRVEFPVYSSLPHLLCPVIYDAQQTLVALKWLVGEMERRFTVLAGANSRDIHSYNSKMEKKGEDKLPYIVLIIDELADLMSVKGKEIESYVVRLAQMSRATGIHLILATQRPSVEVITGLIKANITTRIALKVGSLIDSRTILDSSGAEKLLGKGDMLLLTKEHAKPRRIQSPYISEQEIKKVATFITSNEIEEGEIKEQGEEGYLETKEEEENSLSKELARAMETKEVQMDSFFSKEDPLYEEAKRMVITSRKASATFLQRRLGIGYARAAKLLDILEERGIVGPSEGAKPREIFVNDGEIEE
ncbi:MAG TPA: DNA translocase FtsK 4TM domain-containing protein [Candidatus Pacearchaeota archaeon]|nr:DNA translocase FtsK 4TM domain-containing protein [Candidatus Pacearchaeota archaeon]HQM24481.1 DNA translocase FtsK 4TM domain-containing protein [Candidatus Pacearchaeota archaeon]